MADRPASGFRIWMLIPPAIFLAIAGLAWWGLHRDNPDELPSMLAREARVAPELNLAVLRPGDPAPTREALTAPEVKLVNFWASWCGPCRIEHPILMELAEAGVPIIGVNYKDDPANALGFLAELGDPYSTVGADESGRNGIEWGIYGVPETFVIDAEGRVLLRHPGPITREIYESRFAPLIEGE